MSEQAQDNMARRAALGYLELGMIDDARAELASLSPQAAGEAETLMLLLQLAHTTEQWEEARRLARELRDRQPDAPEWAVMLAFATRRCESLPAARRILVEAAGQFPKEAVIHFNLACYACQLGEMPTARDHLVRALDLDRSYLDLALEDEDLAPMHDQLQAMR